MKNANNPNDFALKAQGIGGGGVVPQIRVLDAEPHDLVVGVHGLPVVPLPELLVSIGYPDESPKPPKRREGTVFFERYGGRCE